MTKTSHEAIASVPKLIIPPLPPPSSKEQPQQQQQQQQQKQQQAVGSMAARMLPKDVRLQLARNAIDSAMKGRDIDLIELTLREGLDAGVPDKTLEKGVMRMAEIAEEDEERARQEAASMTPGDSRASHRVPGGSALSRRSGSSGVGTHRLAGTAAPAAQLREGQLVKLHGLKSGQQLGGVKRMPIDKYNGRLGRVVDFPPPWVIRAITPGSAAVGAQPVPESKFVCVLLDARSTDTDRANGIWLSVLSENLRVQ